MHTRVHTILIATLVCSEVFACIAPMCILVDYPTCTYVCVCTYVCMCAYVFVRMCVYIRMCVHMYVYIPMYVCTYVSVSL